MDIDTHIGEVPGVDDTRLPHELRQFDCRNNRLAELGLLQDGFLRRRAARGRSIGAGNASAYSSEPAPPDILQTELAYRERDPVSGALPASFEYGSTHNTFSVADYIRQRCGLQGPAVAVSCACASSAKVFGSARRMIEAGLIDAALVGGVDSLCLTTLYGFHSLQLTSAAPCRPFDVARDGISIGEAAAFALLERVPEAERTTPCCCSASANRAMPTTCRRRIPKVSARGARCRPRSAAAALDPGDIDYINLHGTATPSNDRSESRAVTSVFGPTTPCSSTKGATGHTLGAAGGVGGGHQRHRPPPWTDAGRSAHQ